MKKWIARYLKKNHKFWVELPKSENHALDLDKKNANTYWSDSISEDMKNVWVAFQILDDDKPVLIGYKFNCCHMILDVNMEDLSRNSCLVVGVHLTETPATMTFASVVSRESVRLDLIIAALNNLEVRCGDVKNSYITVPITEKVWSILGPKFGADAGLKAIIVCALYGFKYAGADFLSHLCICMRDLGYEPCLDDPGLWYKEEVRPDNGHEYYS